jgi:replication factor C small subunit
MTESDEFTIWTEKYRPQTFDEIVGHDEIVKRVRSLTEKENLPHLLFAGPPGVGKCVVADTPVLTESGSITPIKDVDDDQKVLSLDENGTVTPRSINYTHTEQAETVTVHTEDGGSLTVTKDHPFLVLDDGVPTWREAQSLDDGLAVAAPNNFNVENPDSFLPQYSLSERQREHTARMIGSMTGHDSITDEHQRELSMLLPDIDEADLRETLPQSLRFLTSEADTFAFFSTKRDKWTRSFLSGFVADTLRVTEEAYEVRCESEDAATQLTYLLQRLGVRAQRNTKTLRIRGRSASQLNTLLDVELPVIETTETRHVNLAYDHIETVMKSLGIHAYEFSNEVQDALEAKKPVTETLAKYIYQELYEAARARVHDAVRFLDQCESLKDDESSYTATAINNASNESLRQAVMSGHITAFNDLRHQYTKTSLTTALKDLQLRWNGDDESYTERLRDQSVAYAAQTIIEDFNIGVESVVKSIEHTPVQITKTGEHMAEARLMRHRYAVANTLKRIVAQRIYDEALLESLELIHYLSDAQITWDTVSGVDEGNSQQVYDLNVEQTHNFIGGNTPIINHNTTMSLVIAKELYGDSWQQNFLELNASDERGIDIVREKVKDFARTQSLGDVPFKIIYLDEADALTSDAQQALRRTMESYTRSCRFILSCNYSSKIIDPIQSRTTVFRFRGLGEDDVNKLIDRIAKAENLDVTDEGRQALLYASDGDLRRLENMLQTSASIADTIDDDTVYSVASYTDPENVKEILDKVTSGSFDAAKKQLLKTMLGQGLSGPDIIKQFQREIWDLDIPDRDKLDMIQACGEVEFRLIEGSDEHIQLDSLLATFANQTS